MLKFLPCMRQFFMAAFHFFSNYIGDTGPSEKFLSVDHPKEDHSE